MIFKFIDELGLDCLLDFYEIHGDKGRHFYYSKFGFYIDSKQLVGIVAVDGEGKIQGSYLGIIQTLSCINYNACQSIDTLIAREYRGTYLLASLSRRFYEYISSLGIGFSFGLPSHNIRLFRERILKWERLSQTQKFIFPIPIPLLKYVFAPLFSVFDRTQVNSVAIGERKKNTYYRIFNEYVDMVVVKNGVFVEIGTVKSNIYLSRWGKLAYLCKASYHMRGIFFRTYASCGAPSHSFMKGISLCFESLDFSGRFISTERTPKGGPLYIEYIEYDNYGLW
jgi:hypothetical protein